VAAQPGYDPTRLPDDLPVPVDDGAARHLLGATVPSVPLASTADATVDVGALAGRTVLYAYPRTGRPDTAPLVPEWDQIPGARGCTPQACSMRDLHAELLAAGADRVLGLSTQPMDDQREVVQRLHLPYPLLSDEDLRLTDAMRLPAFEVGGRRLLRRFTLVVDDGVVTHCFYPVFPPDTHGEEVLAWLRSNPR
jgi:peroxiredoxin